MKAELHAHSFFSHDALTSPKSFIRFAKQKGLDAIALTDHNTTAGWKAVSAEAKKQDFPLILGEEIKVYDGKQKVGELIGLFMQKQVSAGQLGTVFEELKKQGALIVIPHPFDVRRHPFLRLEEYAKKVDAIEVLNARCWTEKMNQQAKEFVQKNGLVGSAGSDAHTPWEIGRAFVEVPGNDLEEFRKNFCRGKIKVKGNRSNQLVHLFSGLAKLGIKPSL